MTDHIEVPRAAVKAVVDVLMDMAIDRLAEGESPLLSLEQADALMTLRAAACEKHDWLDAQTVSTFPRDGTVTVTVICVRCDAEKREVYPEPPIDSDAHWVEAGYIENGKVVWKQNLEED